jgi:hypothetical protein
MAEIFFDVPVTDTADDYVGSDAVLSEALGDYANMLSAQAAEEPTIDPSLYLGAPIPFNYSRAMPDYLSEDDYSYPGTLLEYTPPEVSYLGPQYKQQYLPPYWDPISMAEWDKDSLIKGGGNVKDPRIDPNTGSGTGDQGTGDQGLTQQQLINLALGNIVTDKDKWGRTHWEESGRYENRKDWQEGWDFGDYVDAHPDLLNAYNASIKTTNDGMGLTESQAEEAGWDAGKFYWVKIGPSTWGWKRLNASQYLSYDLNPFWIYS